MLLHHSLRIASAVRTSPLEARVMLAASLPNNYRFEGRVPTSIAEDVRSAGRPGGPTSYSNAGSVLTPAGTGRSDSATIQAAINAVGSRGGTVRLGPGTFNINRSISLKSKVVLRGSGPRTVLNTTLRNDSRTAIFAVEIRENARDSGIESLTIKSSRAGTPNHRLYQNVDPGNKVGGIQIKGDRNWIKGVSTRNTGSDPLRVLGDSNTVLNSSFNGAWNKGVDSNGYVALFGGRNLFAGNDVENIRHLSIQGKNARGNVVARNVIGTDVNWHNGDSGYNLVAQNEFITPSSHPWGELHTGGPQFGHKPPGRNNFVVDNTGGGEIRPGIFRIGGYARLVVNGKVIGPNPNFLQRYTGATVVV